jgi:hypothetical protein
VTPVAVWRKNVPDIGNTECKSPEGTCTQIFTRNRRWERSGRKGERKEEKKVREKWEERRSDWAGSASPKSLWAYQRL